MLCVPFTSNKFDLSDSLVCTVVRFDISIIALNLYLWHSKIATVRCELDSEKSILGKSTRVKPLSH